MNDIYLNAIDSLQVGMKFFLADNSYSSRKHSILTIFHSIELLLKEYLFRINKILIYKNIDSLIHEDSITVGLTEILMRFRNLDRGFGTGNEDLIKKIQKKRNRIEHHRYDEKEDDNFLIAECLKFAVTFMEIGLRETPERDLDANILEEIRKLIFNYDERRDMANFRYENWLKKNFPSYDKDDGETHEGTHNCPICDQSFLVENHEAEFFCFWCNKSVECKLCENCGTFFKLEENHDC